jgi:hypothetical protein
MQSQKYAAAQQQALESLRSANDETSSVDGAAPDAKKQRGAVLLWMWQQLLLQPMGALFLQCAQQSNLKNHNLQCSVISPLWLLPLFVE